jgi:hypothetical protein
MYRPDIDSDADIIDSRDIIDRIAELESEGYDCAEQENGEEYVSEPDFDAASWLDPDDAEELRTLRDLAEQCEDFPDWQYGETLIRDSYFEQYAQDLAEEIGAVPQEFSWPASFIDWERAAEALQMDYMPVEFDGVTYWIHA